MPDAAPAETAGKKSTPRRIVAVGDLHGDLSQALFTLTMAGLIDGNRDWAGGDAIFVQTGDVVDRGPDTIELYQMMMRLAEQAPLAGGQVLQLLGNHEVMNMQEDLRYVVPMDYETFGGTEARREAWSKDGWLGKYLRTLDITAWVNGTVFFHGGAHPAWARLGIDGMNVEAHKGLIGKTAQDIWNVRLFGGDGPLWYRGYAIDDEASACRLLDMALEEMNATRMVVGHTPQLNGQILRRCKGKFYVIDVGISRVYGGHSAALEIVGDRVTGLYPGGKRVRLQ
ncbi:Metallo-dependent phosphatase-like protein [Entophlyctis helioformis]|nr:Metallo-dependent phosphatase-like protein [Entophlyctis helioformis]